MQLTRQTDLTAAVDAMKEVVLPPLNEEPRVLEDQVHTWTVDSWRALGKKEHGPVFQAGGYPWLVNRHPKLTGWLLTLKFAQADLALPLWQQC